MIVGLTGPHQSGKEELGPLFTELGWEYHNLNEVGDGLRAKGSPVRHLFDELVPGLLYDDGVRKATYYQAILQDPKLLEQLLRLEMTQGVVETAFDLSNKPGNLIVSWEYLHLVATALQPVHVLVLVPRRDVWLERLKARAMDRDWQGDPPRDEDIIRIITALGCMPERIIRLTTKEDAPFRVVDTSAQDFGVTNVTEALGRL